MLALCSISFTPHEAVNLLFNTLSPIILISFLNLAIASYCKLSTTNTPIISLREWVTCSFPALIPCPTLAIMLLVLSQSYYLISFSECPFWTFRKVFPDNFYINTSSFQPLLLLHTSIPGTVCYWLLNEIPISHLSADLLTNMFSI